MVSLSNKGFKMKLTKNQKVLLWNLVCNEYDFIVDNNKFGNQFTTYELDKLKELKNLESILTEEANND
jgi:hypothetical protein